jgi:hypothetical protein
MATTSNVTILYGDHDQINKFHAPIASGTVAAPGDLMRFVSSALLVMAQLTDADTFTGVSLDISKDGDTEDVNVLRRGIVNIGCTSAAYTPGLAVGWAAGANGTAWSLVTVTAGAHGIMWANEYTGTVTDLDCAFDAFVAGGVTAGTGLWDRLAV